MDDAFLSSLREPLRATAPLRWLEPGLAVDIPFVSTEGMIPSHRSALAAMIGTGAIDFAVQPEGARHKKLFLADMDSTMIGQECIDELAAFAGLKGQVSAITERAMRGEIAFEPALRERVALLKGLPVGVIDDVLARHITLNPGALTLVRTMRANGIYCALVSGGFTAFTGPIAARLEFDEHRSNHLGVLAGILDGTVAEPILGREAKLERLLALRVEQSLMPYETLAVGDGANDLAMLGEAGLGVAYRAKPAVAAAADARIDHTDLTTLLFFQGFARHAFVE